MTNYKKLVKIIQDANPELVNVYYLHVCGTFNCDCKHEDLEKKIEEYPIYIRHILIALQKNDNDYPIHINFYFDKDRQLTITKAKGHPTINKECNYQIDKTLQWHSENKQEVIDELLEILS